MPYFLSSFMNQNPGVELQMDVTNKERVITSLEENAVDFSLVSILPTNLQVEKLDLLQNDLYLICKPSAASPEAVTSKDFFRNVPLIYRETGSATRQVMENFFEQQHVLGLKKMELTSNEAVKQAVLAGLGYSIMPLIGIRNELLSHELQILPVDGLPITTTWRLIWPKGKNHSPVASAFLTHVAKEKETIIRTHFGWCEEYRTKIGG
jgi:DNA-binding transcriptional LysR family regulator